jgi:sporulation protein YlmC with PRC-barrel domain
MWSPRGDPDDETTNRGDYHMVRNFNSEDEGKPVMTNDGETIGTVEKTTGTELHVKPEGGLSQSIRRRLGWAEKDADTYSIEKSSVKEISDDGIRLNE